MPINQRGKMWHIDFATPTGQRVRRSAQTTDRKAAEELHDKLKAESWRQEVLGEKPSRTWDEAAIRWLKEQAHKASIRDDAQHIRYLTQFFRGNRLEAITRQRVADAIEALEVGNATRNRYVATVRAIMRRAAGEWEWLEKTPTFRTYKEQKRRIRWITPEEASRLLKHLPKNYAEVARLALATGLRMSNVLRLEWSQLDMQRRCAWIHADQAKARRPIGVPLNDDALEVIRSRIGMDQRFVFDQIARIEHKAWHRACDDAGIEDFRFHDLRHTWASWHVQNGTPLHVLQELGGWETVDMVRRYAHLAPNHLAQYVGNVTFSTQRAESPELARVG